MVFAAWSFAALACAAAFGFLWIVGDTDEGLDSIYNESPRADRIESVLKIMAPTVACLGFALSLERVAARWPW